MRDEVIRKMVGHSMVCNISVIVRNRSFNGFDLKLPNGQKDTHVCTNITVHFYMGTLEK